MDTNPPLQGTLLLRTQVELVSSTTVAGTLYGIAFALYCLYLHASIPLPPDRNRKRQAQIMITCSTMIIICASYFLIMNMWVMQDAYIKHSDLPGGPLIYENFTLFTQPVMVMGFACELVVDVLTAIIQIWRLWVVWSGTRYARLVVMLPSLLLLGFTGLKIRLIILSVTTTEAGPAEGQEIKLGAAVLALRGTVMILTTVLIAGFLILQSLRQSKLIGQSQSPSPYMNIVVMLVESYALESAWIIALIILVSTGQLEASQFFDDTLTYIQVIAYLLVQYRVANGRTYGPQGVHGLSSRREKISSLHWGRATMQSGATSVTDTHTSSSEIQLEANVLPVPERISSPV